MIFNIGGFENVKGKMPEFTFGGTHQLIDDGKSGSTQNWRIKFLTSGEFVPKRKIVIDATLVGGGGGTRPYSGGAGGGYVVVQRAITLEAGVPYQITIGAGGVAINEQVQGQAGGRGGTTSAFNLSADGGFGGVCNGNDVKGHGGNGGSGGGSYPGAAGGTDGANGEARWGNGGVGQGGTTREFGEGAGTMYSSGGNGGSETGSNGNGAANTGNGAGGGYYSGYTGGSGIVVIRNAR